jgi:hypothetical protein
LLDRPLWCIGADHLVQFLLVTQNALNERSDKRLSGSRQPHALDTPLQNDAYRVFHGVDFVKSLQSRNACLPSNLQ